MRITKVLIEPNARDINTHELRPVYQRDMPLEIIDNTPNTVIVRVFGHEMYQYEFKKESIIETLG